MASLPTAVLLYRRPNCSLCDETRATVVALLEERRASGLPAPPLREIDVTGARDMADLGNLVPVLVAGTERLELAIGAARIRRFLAVALDGGAPTSGQPSPPP